MPLTVNWFIPVTHRDYDQMPASVWIRCLQLIPYLEERGVRCTINDPDAEADICVFVRWQDEHAYELARRQKRKGQRVVFDLCVNYFDETGLFEGGYGTTAERVEECLRMVEIADVVTCASAYIARRARDFHPWAVYLPDSIDPEHFRLVKPEQDFERPKLRAIWSGIAPKARELEPILPLLRYRRILLTIVSNEKPSLSPYRSFLRWPYGYRFIRWRYETFPRSALEGELCVVHRPVDNPYDLGHSLFKIGVFLAQGVPVIASPVPSYQEVLGTGNGGVLCGSLDEWEGALDTVLEDREALVTWSRGARRAMQPYRTDRVADRYAALFTEVCER